MTKIKKLIRNYNPPKNLFLITKRNNLLVCDKPKTDNNAFILLTATSAVLFSNASMIFNSQFR